MTHLSGHFIDAGPSVGTVALKEKKATTWLACRGGRGGGGQFSFTGMYLNNLPIKTRLSPPRCRRQTAPRRKGGGGCKSGTSVTEIYNVGAAVTRIT